MLIVRVLGCLPYVVLYYLGGLVGCLYYACSARFRRQLREKWGLLGARGIHVSRLAVVMSHGRALLEMPYILGHSARHIATMVRRVDDVQCIEAVLRERQPIILLTPHMGSFEVLPRYWAHHFVARSGDMTVLYHPPKQTAAAAWVASAREVPGVQVATTSAAGVRKLLRALKNKQVVGVLPDHVPSRGEGLWVPFLGQMAYTMTLPGRLVDTSGACLLLMCAKRLSAGQGFDIICKPYTAWIDEPWPDGDRQAQADLLNRVIERVILECPEQYMWAYNRYRCPAGVEPYQDLV